MITKIETFKNNTSVKVNEEVINNQLYFYHSTKSLESALYIVKKQWRTTMGMYGNGVYGQQYANPLDKNNNLSSAAVDRYKQFYGNSYRFKIRYNNPEDIFYLDLDAGREVYPDYDENMAIAILKKHKVPQRTINAITPYFSTKTNVPAISNSVFATSTVDGGLLGQYGFKGLVYQGNLDGSCVLFWYPNNSDLEVVEYSQNFGKSWTKYDSNNKQQVQTLINDIQHKIDELNPVLTQRNDTLSQTGKRPALSISGEDRDWVRIIECGDKAGFDFRNGNITAGDVNKFVALVQKQINASSEPKRSNRYNIAIKIMPNIQSRLTL